MSKIHPQASSFTASYKQTPKFKSFLLKEHANEEARWPNNKSADNNTDVSVSDVYNQTRPVDYSCVYVKENQLANNLVDYSSMPPLVSIDHSAVHQQLSKATASQIPLKKRSKQYESLWTPTAAGDLPLSPVTLPESPQSLSLLEDSDNDKINELTQSTQQSDNLSESPLSGSTGKLIELSLSNNNPGDPLYSPTSPGNLTQQYIHSYHQYQPRPYTRPIEYPVNVPSLPYSHRPLHPVNHSNYTSKGNQVNKYFFPLGGPIPSRKVAEELKATQLDLFRDSYRLSTASPHAFAPYRKPRILNKSMDTFNDMSHTPTENQPSQPSHGPKYGIHDLHNGSLNLCREPNRQTFIPQRPSAFKKSLPSFLDPDCSSSHPSAHVNSIEKIESSNDDYIRQKHISEWTFSEVVTYMSRKQDSMNLKFNFTPLSGITGRELMSFSPDILNAVAPGHGEKLYIMLRELQHEQDKNSIADSVRRSYELDLSPANISKPTYFSIEPKLAQRDCVTSHANPHIDYMVRSPHEYKQMVSLENLHSPREFKPRESLENVHSPLDYKHRDSLENLPSPLEYQQRESFENIQSPLEYKHSKSYENLKSPQEIRPSEYLRYSYDILGSNEDYDIYNDMKCSPHSSRRSEHYPEHTREGYQVPNIPSQEQYMVDISSASSSHQLPSAARKSYAFLHSPEYSIANLSPEKRSSGDGEASKPAPVPTVKRGPGRPRKPENELKRKKKRTGRLWEFIRNLLHDPETCPSLVKWENAEEGVFRFVQAEKVAKMWGMRKHNSDMNYEKLSRAMRYYYKGGVFEIVAGRRLVYKFGKAAKNWRPSDPNFPNFQR
ncbi:unnamed protein product, partial [Meganyctiphanes norvegica]